MTAGITPLLWFLFGCVFYHLNNRFIFVTNYRKSAARRRRWLYYYPAILSVMVQVVNQIFPSPWIRIIVILGIVIVLQIWADDDDDDDQKKRKRATARGGINWLKKPFVRTLPKPT